MPASAPASPRWRSSPNRQLGEADAMQARKKKYVPLSARAGGSGEAKIINDINTTPLIDVMLVLLVMLIITIPIQLHAVNLEMPVGTPPNDAIKPEKVQIDIDEKSVVYWQGLPVTAAELDQKMEALAKMT